MRALGMRSLLLGIALLSCLACARGGRLEGQVYRGPDATYRIGELGPEWRRLGVGGHNDVAFEQPRLAAIIQVNASCNAGLDVPLEALTRHLLIGFTERELRSQERVPLASREALRTHAVAKLDGVPREMLLHVLKKDGCVYDLSLVAPPGDRFARAQGDYEASVAAFATGGGGT
jgi:hypothetical protein